MSLDETAEISLSYLAAGAGLAVLFLAAAIAAAPYFLT